MTPELSPQRLLFPRLVRFDQPQSTPAPEPEVAHEKPTPAVLTGEEISRLYLWQRALEEKHAALERRALEVDQRFERVVTDASELEAQVKMAAIDEARLHAEAERLHRLRHELEQRQSADSARAEQIDSQQAKFAVVKARLDRLHLEQHREATAIAAEQAALAHSRAELDERLRDAERLRVEFGMLKTGTEAERRALSERQSLFNTQLEELNRQRENVQAEAERLAQRQKELDAQSAELAEQTAVMKAKAQQVIDYHARLEADRAAVRDREASLYEAEDTRQTLQEQLRKRADELSTRAKVFDEQFRKLATERQDLNQQRDELAAERVRVAEELLQQEKRIEERELMLKLKADELAAKEETMARQVARLREVGAAVAAERKTLAGEKNSLSTQRQSFAELHQDSFYKLEELKSQAPTLQLEAQATLERLAQVRDSLRNQLAELHSFAAQGRAELDAAKQELHQREAHLESAKAEHRHMVAAFRQQVAEWQAKLAEARTTTTTAEARVEQKHVVAEESQRELLRQQDMLRAERARLAERRGEVERHLGDLREWYRHKLKELANTAKAEDPHAGPELHPAQEQPEPGDKQLGEVLMQHHFVDSDTLQTLWAEARKQRRTLRQVLLASGTITLYQLALIEAGNVEALIQGRFRVVDRLRATPRETVFRVYDPLHAGNTARNLPVLRVLSEAEMQDAVHPDEFRQRFAALARAQSDHLATTWEILDVGGRAAALQEYVVGLPGGDWPGVAPGVWLKLITGVAAGLAALHRVGLTHGRLASDAVILTATGTVKLLDGGLPDWLAGPARTTTEAQDLRMLGQLAHAWAMRSPAAPGKARRPRVFPEPLLAIARRLEAEGSNPMADEVPAAYAYRDADDLLSDLHRLAAAYPCPPEDWNQLVSVAAHHTADTMPLRLAG